MPLAGGRVGYDVRDIIAALKDADIVFINWPTPSGHERGQAVFGFSLAADPEILEFGVRDEREAAAVGEAKRAVDMGNDLDAYVTLRTARRTGDAPDSLSFAAVIQSIRLAWISFFPRFGRHRSPPDAVWRALRRHSV